MIWQYILLLAGLSLLAGLLAVLFAVYNRKFRVFPWYGSSNPRLIHVQLVYFICLEIIAIGTVISLYLGNS